MERRGEIRTNLVGMDRAELELVAQRLGEASFRGRQLFIQMYRRKIFDPGAMTDLSKTFRERLMSEYRIALPEILAIHRSQDGSVKFLFGLEDGENIEAVYIPDDDRATLCISSQVGCAVGCAFCMTARMGFRRNLNSGEIVGQVLRVIREGCLAPQGFNIVFMGMGEPLYNYRNVMKAFRLLIDADGMDLSYRKITLSTSGVVPVLRRMREENVLPNLAISLNAASDEVRSRIMPINEKWSLGELMDALAAFPLEPRRRITIEYVLLAGENDSPQDAEQLAALLRGLRVKVNLIPYNENPGLPYRAPDQAGVERFQEVLRRHGIGVYLRKRRGADIAAACGQLANRQPVTM